MTIGSLFSGIGGLELGLEWAGLGPVAYQVENNTFCRSVLAKHWPEVPKYDDVSTLDPAVLPPVDILCGGFPCQDVSSAGKGAGLAGARSGLWYEYRRIVEGARPPWVVVENVASGARRWLPHVRRDMHLLGYRTRAIALSAADVGAPHLRRRVFVLAADPERVELREQSGWRGGPDGEGSALAGDDGADGDADAVGDTVHVGREGAKGQGHEGRPESPARGWWASEPHVGRVVDGLPGGLVGRERRDRLRALGNAVVPQCAEVIGKMILGVYARGRR
jgi:DNA (cytosine-5)-methyltransferase 1